MCEELNFEDFEIDKETGFASELTHSLPDYYNPWHQLASQTCQLVAEQRMRTETEKLPLLETNRLTDFRDLRLAHLQLVVITQGYAWEHGPQHVAQSIPSNVAIPLCEISDKLGVPAGMCYFTLLGNWTRKDPHGPYTRQNIKPIYMMPGGDDFLGFLSLAVQMEVFFTKAFPAIHSILKATKEKDDTLALSGLQDLLFWLKEYGDMAKDFHNVMQPDIFFRVIIAFLRGFNETCGLPEGMLYEGVNDRPRRIVLNAAASQAPVFQFIDALMGVQFPKDKLAFFEKLRSSWCEQHRQLFEKIQTWPGSLREMVEQNINNEMVLAYNNLVEAVKQFRSYHVQLVTKYTIIPNKRLRSELKEEGPDHFAYLMPLLKGIRDETAASQIDA